MRIIYTIPYVAMFCFAWFTNILNDIEITTRILLTFGVVFFFILSYVINFSIVDKFDNYFTIAFLYIVVVILFFALGNKNILHVTIINNIVVYFASFTSIKTVLKFTYQTVIYKIEQNKIKSQIHLENEFKNELKDFKSKVEQVQDFSKKLELDIKELQKNSNKSWWDKLTGK